MGEGGVAAYISRHPLTDSAPHGIEMPGDNHLELVDGARIHSVLAFKGREWEVADVMAELPEASIRNVGPGEWQVASSDALQSPAIDGAMVADQSHGRALLRLTGPDAVRILMKGTGVDIEGGAFPVGSSANMAYGHLTINLMRVADRRFELIVGRSFAESLYHDLKVAGREFGLTFGVAGI
jgi:heterotetrameric sarcosine oxidase gamma subunit